MKNKALMMSLVLVLVLLAWVLASHSWYSRGYGGLVLAENGQPLQDVKVLVAWRLRGGNGGYPRPPDVLMETRTNKLGEFSFPGWGLSTSLFERMLCEEPTVMFLKPGYVPKTLEIGKCHIAFRSVSLDVTPEFFSTRMHLPKNKTDHEYAAQAVLNKLSSFEGNAKNSACIWYKVPMFYAAAADLKSIHPDIIGGVSTASCQDPALRAIHRGETAK